MDRHCSETANTLDVHHSHKGTIEKWSHIQTWIDLNIYTKQHNRSAPSQHMMIPTRIACRGWSWAWCRCHWAWCRCHWACAMTHSTAWNSRGARSRRMGHALRKLAWGVLQWGRHSGIPSPSLASARREQCQRLGRQWRSCL